MKEVYETMSYTDTEVALEALNHNLDRFSKLLTAIDINTQRNPLAKQVMVNSDEFIDSFAGTVVNLTGIIKNAQSTSFGDKLIQWFGIFDKELKSVKARRSELLAKKDVQNYTYKRHTWHYRYLSNMPENIFTIMDMCLNTVIFAINQSNNGRPQKEIDNIIADFYKRTIDPNIDSYLFGKKKGALYKNVVATLIGDGYNEKVVTVNFKDEVDISTLIDWAEDLCKIDFNFYKKDWGNRVNEINGSVKDILNKLNTQAKANPKNAAFCTRHLKVCSSYLAMLVGKLQEFADADTKSFKTVTEEIIKILQGLLDYKGN